MKTPAQIYETEMGLLKNLKNEIANLRDDPFGDAEYFSEQVVTYAIVEGVTPRIDPKAKGKYNLIVETSLFGGSKHLDGIEYETQRSLLLNG